MSGPELAYEDGVIAYTIYVSYDVALRNIILQKRQLNYIEYLTREYQGDSHCISYLIYKHGKLIDRWMRPDH